VFGLKQQVSLLERHGCVHHETWEQVRVYAKQEDKKAILCSQLAHFKVEELLARETLLMARSFHNKIALQLKFCS
jgi:hypothetical protein